MNSRFPLFESMRTKQRERFLKVEKRGKKILPYKPRIDFVNNLAAKMGLSYEQVCLQLAKEREELIYIKGLIMGKRQGKTKAEVTE